MQFAVTGKLIPQLTATLLEIKYFPDEVVMASFVAAWAVGAFIIFLFACRWAERKSIVYTDLIAVLTAVVRDFGSEVEAWRPWSALRLSCVLFKFQTLRFATLPCPNQSKSLQIGCWTSVGRQEACGFGRSGFEWARPEGHGIAACPFMRYVHYFGRSFN